MSIVADLLAQPGVLVAGQFSYRGDRYSYRGELSEEQARLLSIVCRTTTMTTNMNARILANASAGATPKLIRGWILRGPELSLCAHANTFCLFNTSAGSANQLLHWMSTALADETMDLL